MSEDHRKVCFVVMGFGKKTDFESGRLLDLDATYEAIIRPAAEANGLRVIRADEIMRSGTIDVYMYDMLLRADLVIADISTGNVNAVYELGVRHALRPSSTIVMKEKVGKLYFDLNHTSTFSYEHMGEDIGAREARRASQDLLALIKSVMDEGLPDSPVYVYLPNLQRPLLSDDQYARLLIEAEASEAKLSNLLKSGVRASNAGEHGLAANAFREALTIKPGDAYLIQQLALNTYKAKHPSPLAALREALAIIEELTPGESNDPETVGITGAIHKGIWQLSNNLGDLQSAIKYYRRGFEIRRDYYTGENLATCLMFRSTLQSSAEEATYDRMSAKKVREQIAAILADLVTSEDFADRTDQKWVFATFANVSYGLRRPEQASRYEKLFYESQPVQWESDTYEDGKRAIFLEVLST